MYLKFTNFPLNFNLQIETQGEQQSTPKRLIQTNHQLRRIHSQFSYYGFR